MNDLTTNSRHSNKQTTTMALQPTTGYYFDYQRFEQDLYARTRTIFRWVWNRSPHQMQLVVLRCLGQMSHPQHPLKPGPVCAVLPTGGGKSAIRDAHSIAHGMFSLTIVPLLSVGSDQATKIRPLPNWSFPFFVSRYMLVSHLLESGGLQ